MAEGRHHIRRRSSDPIPERKCSESNNNSYSLPANSRISMSALRRGLTLPVNNMAIPIYSATSPTREDVEMGGQILFQHFIEEELLQEGISEQILDIENPPPDEFGDASPEMRHSDTNANSRVESVAFHSTPEGYKTIKLTKLGKDIRDIADVFAHSHERSLIRHQADEVDLSHINYSTFQHMLSALFENGINKYRIVALFYFCSDVLIRCVKDKLHELGRKLFFWALEFLFNNICKWVQDHGGWERVFSNMFNMAYKAAVIGALGIVICCGVVWIRKNM